MRKAIKLLFFSFIIAFFFCSDFLGSDIRTPIYENPNQYVTSEKQTTSDTPFKYSIIAYNLKNLFVKIDIHNESAIIIQEFVNKLYGVHPYLILKTVSPKEIINHEASVKTEGRS